MKLILKLLGMVVVGLSAISITQIGVWFVIPWVIGWLIYDAHFYL